MTFVQSKQQIHFLHILSGIVLTVLFLGNIAWLVVIYNKTINLHAAISKVNQDARSIEAQSAEIKDMMFRMLGSENLRNFATKRKLISEKNPKYLEVSSQWSAFASRY